MERFFASHEEQTTSANSFPTKQDLKDHINGQLSLFPPGSTNTLLQWQKEKVDFVELFVAIYESNSVKAINEKKLSKKDFFEILMWFFNIRIGHWHGTLNAAKARKIEKGSPYLNELLLTFSDYAAKGL
ncbi:MAG: RteC domain-containing protein [Bacteroidetes bacterium]|nr:RteC domain-containing protein [Bacteroidota bacterium]